jgi:hypothetical protein
MDPFRIGMLIVVAILLFFALPLIAHILIGIVPSVLLLAFTFWILKSMINKLLS